MSDTSITKSSRSVFFLLTYLAVLVLHCRCMLNVTYVGALAPLFSVAAYLVYTFIYLTPAILLVEGLQWLLARRGPARGWRRSCVPAAAIAATSLLQILLYSDHFIYALYGFHLNGFVWNLVFTRGGLDSLGGGTSTTISFGLVLLGFVGLQAGLYLVAARIRIFESLARPILRRRWFAVSMLIVLAIFEQVAYGLSYMRGYTPVLVASNAFPIYFPISFNRLAESLGVSVVRDRSMKVDVDSIHLQYPRRPLVREQAAKSYNIVWLVAESLRADMLDPEIMPKTWAFAHQSLWLRNHYSGGNGTRMGIFTLFYGLYGYYWFPFLQERRGPLLIDELIDRHYQMECYTGAGFSYPEFDKTVFVRMDPKRLHENCALQLWQRDEENVTDVISFIEKRDPARPFMTYIFFESPHANYHFPKQGVLRPDYGRDLNYATMDLQKDIGLIKSRYVNACHYLDSQIARMIDYLREKNLLDSTIVLITGDHGEEFMEKGRWGHNSAFTQEQIRTPAVLWVPGRSAKAVDDMTCHLDFPPTILRLLGVTNPPEDYSLGVDLLGEKRHEYLVLADWNTLAYVDPRFKVILPLKVFGFGQQVTTLDDEEIKDDAEFFTAKRDNVIQVMRNLKQFSK